jgi:hypothetical protein
MSPGAGGRGPEPETCEWRLGSLGVMEVMFPEICEDVDLLGLDVTGTVEGT